MTEGHKREGPCAGLGLRTGKIAPLILLATCALAACGSLGDLNLISVRKETLPTVGGKSEMDVVARYSTSIDLSEKDKNMLWGKVWFCDLPDANVLLGPLHTDANSATERVLMHAGMETYTKMGPPPYSVTFRVSAPAGVPSDRPPMEAFDLHQNARDVCFRLEEGPYSKLGAKSGIMIIPKEKISAAIAGVGEDQTGMAK